MSKKNQDVNVNYNYSGVGFFSMLGVLFVGLKLTGYIDWSWWLVLLPIYGPIIVVLTLIFLILLVLNIITN